MSLLHLGPAPDATALRRALDGHASTRGLKLESFEEYGQALDYCKGLRGIGFAFLSGEDGAIPPANVFHQLSRPFESKGTLAFGALLRHEPETLRELRALRQAPRLVGSYELGRLSPPEVWTDFIRAFENHVLSRPLQETLISLASRTLSTDSLRFMNRVATLIGHQLEIPWIELIALRWGPVLSRAGSASELALAPHTLLRQLAAMTKHEDERTDASLCSVLSGAIESLDQMRRKGRLAEALARIPEEACGREPQASISAFGARILEIASEEAAALDAFREEGA